VDITEWWYIPFVYFPNWVGFIGEIGVTVGAAFGIVKAEEKVANRAFRRGAGWGWRKITGRP
jgi:hypothetical protein